MILAFPLTSVADNCIMTASIVYADDQPCKLKKKKKNCKYFSKSIISQSTLSKKYQGKYLRGHQFHAEGPTIQYVTTMQDGMNHSYKWWVERERILQKNRKTRLK